MERALRDFLPPSAAMKLTVLSDAISESSVLIASHIRRVNELRASIGNVFAHGKNAEANRELARMLAKQTAQQVRFRESSQLLAGLEHWLQNLPRNVVLEDIKKHSKPKFKGSAVEAVEAIRDKLKTLRKDISAVQRATPTAEEMKAAVRATVQANGDRARPKITATEHKFDVTFGTLDFSTRAITPFEIECWLHPDDVVAKLDAEIDALPVSPLALSAADKAARLEELSAAMLSLERDEEALIAGSAQEIARRPQADPRAVLGVIIVKKTKMPETAEAVA